MRNTHYIRSNVGGQVVVGCQRQDDGTPAVLISREDFEALWAQGSRRTLCLKCCSVAGLAGSEQAS